jgi:hypothetical protein
LRACPEVSELRVNPATASVLLIDPHGVPLDAVREHAESHGLFEMPNGGRLHLVDSVVLGARRLDEGLRQVSGEELDLKTLVFVLLFGGALYQLIRGQLLAPASTLGWYAAALLVRPLGSVMK